MKDQGKKSTFVNQRQRGQILLTAACVLVLIATLPELSRPSVLRSAAARADKDSNQSSVNRPVEPVELLRQALANFKARGSRARDYVYVVHYKNKLADVRVSPNWEIMSVEGQPFRRHLGLNGLPLSPDEEKEAERKIPMRESVEVHTELSHTGGNGAVPGNSKIVRTRALTEQEVAQMEELGERFKKDLAFDAEEMRNGGSLLVFQGVEMVGGHSRQLQLPLQCVPDDFDIRLKGQELLEARNTYIIEAKPRRKQKTPTGDAEDASNFKMTIWIDELETEIVKVEGKAIHSGIVDRSSKIAPQYVNQSPECEAKLLKSPPEGTLSYAAGTVAKMEWKKINGEAWLPAEVQFKTKQIYTAPDCLGKNSEIFSQRIPWGYKIEFSDYKKFHVEVHISLPH